MEGALVIGQGRFQAALLIEPKPEAKATILEEVWSLVQKANSLVPGQGRVTRDKILLCTSDKSLPRAAKGTIIRKVAERAYRHEIEALYKAKQASVPMASVSLRATFELSAIKDFVRSIIKSSSVASSDITDEQDFYAYGLDSLGTVEITSLLRAGPKSYRSSSDVSWIGARTIYENPSIKKLATVLSEFLNAGTIPTLPDCSDEISSLTKKYTPNIQPTPSDGTGIDDPNSLRLTMIGATGNLGSHLLDALLQDSRISQVYCLSRTKPSVESPKMEFHEVDYEKSTLGLKFFTIEQISRNSDMIILNAWKTDFNQSLQSFESNLRSLSDLVQTVSQSQNRPRIIFMSSAAAAARWGRVHNNRTTVPEAPLKPEFDNPSLAMGYAQSKLDGERILTQVAKLYNIPVTILRIGQIAGPSTSDSKSSWPIHEWFPTAIKTSKAIGILPQLGQIDWIPIDRFVSAFVEILHHQTTLEPFVEATYNIVNPQPIPWDSIVEPILEHFAPGAQVVSLSEWLEKVNALGSSQDGSVDIKILDFLGLYDEAITNSTLEFHTEKLKAASKTSSLSNPISKEMMKIWMNQWGS